VILGGQVLAFGVVIRSILTGRGLKKKKQKFLKKRQPTQPEITL
jgi:hypothetical protein